ncbi:polyprenol monophosphomannose synthase [Mycolicibacterium sediminis]|uniref:dolichyl-phosphate beta-D-mannosyltransferase n=1 Tax=Mycolicibacterium sediminis TaxID=1286180 RepID=A0A7I7QPA1_9MYCO|nr:polyprenol monophosphomannose synthase [Mycolicibacterium sediminis]BBY28219.1 polyprenol monophosphomannose synthase [Mycolicibacterium sediminis]
MTRTVVVIPTYNEIDNVALIVDRTTSTNPDVHVLVVDDDSPDGTGAAADRIALRLSQVHVLHRSAKEGLGAAYLAGFAWALDQGFDVVVEMDADGSHAPEQLEGLLTAISRGAHVAIGSRYVAGGATVNWPRRRRMLSKTANAYARLALGAPINDITSGYRAYRSEVLADIDFADVHSRGYGFQVEMAWRAIRLGGVVVEVPITFVERRLGASKMDIGTIWEAVTNIARWGVQHRFGITRETGRDRKASR